MEPLRDGGLGDRHLPDGAALQCCLRLFSTMGVYKYLRALYSNTSGIGLEQVRRLNLSIDNTQGSAVLRLDEASTGASLTPLVRRSWHKDKDSGTPGLRRQL